MTAPANKLAIKFPNEAVISYFLLFKIIKLKIVIVTTLNIVSTFLKKYNKYYELRIVLNYFFIFKFYTKIYTKTIFSLLSGYRFYTNLNVYSMLLSYDPDTINMFKII